MTAPQTDAPTLQERLRSIVPDGRPFTVLERFEADQTAKQAADALDERDATIAALVDALGEAIATIADYVDYEHDGDPWTEDARAMGEMDIDEFARDGRFAKARAALAKAAALK